jgi:hypothetical protein
MNTEIVKSDRFEKSKKRLQNFSQNLHSSSQLTNVPETYFFEFFDRNVTGKDFNKAINYFQNRTYEINASLITIIDEFKTIHETFDYLDKDYVQAILIAQKSAEKSSEQADKNYNLIESLLHKLQFKFGNIESQFEEISKDVKSVSVASKKINKIEHMEDIDATYIQAAKNRSSIDKIGEDLFKIRASQEALKIDFIEGLKVSKENSLKNIKEYSNNMAQDLDEIRASQDILKIDLIEKFKVSNENSLKIYKQYSNKLTIVSIVAVLSLILSISMIAINLMNNA